jgi:hypothetical protein
MYQAARSPAVKNRAWPVREGAGDVAVWLGAAENRPSSSAVAEGPDARYPEPEARSPEARSPEPGARSLNPSGIE